MATFYTISKINFQNFAKSVVKKNFNIKLDFNSFKIQNYLSYKDPISNDLKSILVFKFTCANCSSNYIGENCRHFKTRIEEHLKKDHKSHIFKHLHSTATCFDSYNPLCFKIIDKASSKFDLKTKEALHINWRKPNLNAQQNHCLCLFFFCCFLHFSFIYCFHYLYANYRYLLLS